MTCLQKGGIHFITSAGSYPELYSSLYNFSTISGKDKMKREHMTAMQWDKKEKVLGSLAAILDTLENTF